MPLRSKLLCALTVAFALCTAATAQAATGMEVAVQDDPALFAGIYSTPQIGLGLARKLKSSKVRVNVIWSYIVGRKAAKARKKPKRIKYNWSGYDLLVGNAARYGMKVQMVLTGPAPAWATGNHKIGPYKPKAGLYKDFAAAVAKHFRGRVNRYSVWNEPNHKAWLSPLSSGPKLYRSLYLAGYGAIKHNDPSAQVLIGETSPFEISHGRTATAPLKFLRGVTCAKSNYSRARNCATLKTDGYAQHPYDFAHKPTYKYPGKDNVTIGVIDRLTAALSKLNGAGLLKTPSGGIPFIYLTEFGYLRAGKKKMSEPKRAKYLPQAFDIALHNPQVKEMLQYEIVQPTKGFAIFDTSLATRKGKPGQAFKALAAWAQKAAGQLGAGPPPTSGGGGTPGGGGGGSGGGGGGGGGCTVVAGIPICP